MLRVSKIRGLDRTRARPLQLRGRSRRAECAELASVARCSACGELAAWAERDPELCSFTDHAECSKRAERAGLA